MKRGTRRERLDRATKRTKRGNPSLTWKQARALALRWCVAMWPDSAQLNDAAGAGSQLQTCSMCPPGFYGCQTGDAC